MAWRWKASVIPSEHVSQARKSLSLFAPLSNISSEWLNVIYFNYFNFNIDIFEFHSSENRRQSKLVNLRTMPWEWNHPSRNERRRPILLTSLKSTWKRLSTFPLNIVLTMDFNFFMQYDGFHAMYGFNNNSPYTLNCLRRSMLLISNWPMAGNWWATEKHWQSIDEPLEGRWRATGGPMDKTTVLPPVVDACGPPIVSLRIYQIWAVTLLLFFLKFSVLGAKLSFFRNL